MNLSVVIPTYKKIEQLLKNLEHNLLFLPKCEVIIVNDDPERSIKKIIDKKFPKVILVENEKNLGFGPAVNKGVALAKNDYVMLLNSDVKLLDSMYLAALDHFASNSSLFAISFAQKEKDGSLVGKNTIYWKKGFLLHKKADNLSFGKTAWAEGGACIVDKKKFDNLKGFDEIYSPFYWEDIDLSYRAWKAGYEIIFDPEVVVEHHHESTIGSYFKQQYIRTIAYRNQFLVVWRNIRNWQLLLSHFIYLPFHLFSVVLRFDTNFVKGFIMAVFKLITADKRDVYKKKRDDLTVIG